MAMAASLSLLLAFAAPSSARAFALPAAFSPSPPARASRPRGGRAWRSTPFDLDFYDAPSPNDDADRPNGPPAAAAAAAAADADDAPPLAAPPSTRLVLGLTKHSHDAAICAADAATGEVLFAVAKERLTRRKHDGGHAAALVEACLDALDLGVEDVDRVVLNNHHHRILPLEADAGRLAWEEGLGINGADEDGHGDEYNVLAGGASKVELSHHLAHAYSVAAQCPFDRGLVVVMDGMGETYRTMKTGMDDDTYASELALCDADTRFVPADVDARAGRSRFDWREAESVYTFRRDVDGRELTLKPVFKRFAEEVTPPALHNHGFADMDSLGAVYSRASSHIFGDWNACGKVMGLAPWAGHSWDDDDDGAAEGALSPPVLDAPILAGALHREGEGEGLSIDRSRMMGLPFIARMDPDLFDDDGNMVRERRYDFDDNDDAAAAAPRGTPPAEAGPGDGDGDGDGAATPTAPSPKRRPTGVALDAIGLAARVQADLEATVLDFVRHFKDATGETALCLAGGVALNSVLNGRLSRELGFEDTFVSECGATKCLCARLARAPSNVVR